MVQAWPQVRIEHVETEADGQALGSALTVRVSVALGALTPDDVMVEVVYGRPDDADEIVSPAYAVLAAEEIPPAETPAPGRHLLRGSCSAPSGTGPRRGSCGIPVRCRSTSQDRSGTRCGCCRTIRCSTAGPNSAW